MRNGLRPSHPGQPAPPPPAAFPEIHTMRFVVASTLCLAFALGAATNARAADYPEPSPYPISWELDFQHDKPKRIVVTIPGQGNRAYWYMTYTVANKTNEDRPFLPVFEMVTRDGKVHRSDKDVPMHVFQQIKRQEKAKYPFLEPYYKVAGTLRVGEDQAKDGVAIWPEPMSEMGNFSVYISGLSGETVTMKMVDGKPVKVKPENVALELKGVDEKDVIILRKTLQLNYVIYGDEVFPGLDEVNVQPEKWVMR
jgi:hypothetical protein